jgi:tetratricopeptide (TPR) repeat protein
MASTAVKYPKKIEQLIQSAHKNRVNGDYAQAKAQYKETLAQYPKHLEALCGLAALASDERDFKAAAELLERAVLAESRPNATLYFSLALAYHQKADLISAEKAYLQALKLSPQYSEASYNLGVVYRAQNQHDEALVRFERAVQDNPNYVDAHYNMGNALKDLGQFARAIQCYARAIELSPRHTHAHLNQGLAYKALGEFDHAVACMRSAIDLNPSYADAHSNLGMVYTELKNWPQALASFQQALTIDPNHAQALWNTSLLLLLHENFSAGFSLYPSRWREEVQVSPSLVTSKPLFITNLQAQTAPNSQTQSQAASKLLIWPEQGIGDEIMFGALLHQAKTLAQQVLVQMDSRLIPLFKRSFPELTWIDKGACVDESLYDTQMPIGRLAEIFCQSREHFTHIKPNYLSADPVRTAAIRQKIKNHNRPIIGISWRSQNTQKGQERSVALSELVQALMVATERLKPLVLTQTPAQTCGEEFESHGRDAENPQLTPQLINLQYRAQASELSAIKDALGIEITQLDEVDNFQDIDGLASLIECCDCVVSIDNSTVHLAGALGRPTIVLLPYSCDWRWGLSEDKSLWYPSLHLIRQSARSQWHASLERLGSVLEQALVATGRYAKQ